MKKIIILFVVLTMGLSAFAASQKVVGLSDAQISSMNTKIDCLTRKIYGGAFLSPTDTSNLIGIKIKLDDSMLLSPDTRYAVLYYKLGKIYQHRGKKAEAIECYQAIIENFPNIVLAPKAGMALKSMGIEVKLPEKNTEDSEE